MAKHKKKKLVFQGVLRWIKTCWYESNYMFWWSKNVFNKTSSHRAIFSKSCFIKAVTHNLHSIHRVTKRSLTRATILQGFLSYQTDICFHLGSWSAVVYLVEQTPCWGAALVGLGWTPLHLSSSTGCWSKNNGTANTCSYTAPPVGQRMRCELLAVGLIETYSLSSFLFLILPSKQDERGHSWAKCSFQWGATFLLLW